MPFLLSLTLGCSAEVSQLLKFLVSLYSLETFLFPNVFLAKLYELHWVHLVHQLPVCDTEVRKAVACGILLGGAQVAPAL